MRCVDLLRRYLISAAVLFGAAHAVKNEVRCASIDIRNDPTMAFQSKNLNQTWEGYSRCTLLEGDVSITLVANPNDGAYPVFRNLREITGHLLVFKAVGLKSLGKIFPNLRVIGGNQLVMNYAMVVYQNDDLEDIGLTKLSVIKNGGIRITENPRLCYARYIRWDVILRGKLRDQIVQEGEKCAGYCSLKESESRKCHHVDGVVSCWNDSTCQPVCAHQRYSNGAYGPGCAPDGSKCHEQCVGGCFRKSDSGFCYACRSASVDGTCVETCPAGFFERHDKRCMTKEECNTLYPVKNRRRGEISQWKAFNGICHYECPSGFKEDPRDPHNCVKCDGYCPMKCAGDKLVDSIGDALKFSKCNFIEGHLEVDLRVGADTVNAERFAEAFGEIEEITGYLLIRFSTAFMSLHMFKKLRVIRGEQLWRDTYALVLFENQNLRQLFNIQRQPLRIVRGKVSMQNNRMLCYSKIDAFLGHIGQRESVTENDVSKYSNGDKAICQEIPLEITTIRAEGPNSIIIGWTPFETTNMDHRKFLGYQIFYKKVDREDPNMSIDDDRSSCADSWAMFFVSSEDGTSDRTDKGHMIGGLSPNTLYAFYVQTKVANHPGARSAVSKIVFVKTLFYPPEAPRLKVGKVVGPDRIILEWDPPKEPNGEITHYTVKWDANPETIPITLNPCTDHVMSVHRRARTHNYETESAPAEEGTCPADKGCCACADEDDEGQNAPATEGQEPGDSRKSANATLQHKEDQTSSNKEPAQDRKTRSIKDIRRTGDKPSDNKTPLSKTEILNVNLPFFSKQLGPMNGSYNTTGRALILVGLRHFTEYQISIVACQDVRAPEHHCSSRPLYRTLRTAAIPDNDLVAPQSIVVANGTNVKPDERLVSWDAPAAPNGIALAYIAKIHKEDGSTPRTQCIRVNSTDERPEAMFNGLTDGRYTLELRVITLAGISDPILVDDVFVVEIPGFFTLKRILMIIGSLLAIVAAVAAGIAYFGQQYVGRKVREYWQQVVSANPDYISQLDVYEADEWELKRDDLELGDELGRGTFGKVVRGFGKNITSVCGVTFGECAIKTVSDTASSAERLRFLVEASVMKQFNTSFIVKLYGVVSDGQPTLVVMELMERGNLRDYLRAHRPGDEENVDNRPVPEPHQYFAWAAEIADGMAYLESMKFCHRDLAARNCMVGADESVKIGDFGMARDIYYHEYYKPTGKRLMPVRWMAPESLKDGKFSMYSDVWSYGIVLYEMLTLGQQPYAGLSNEQVFNFISTQRRVMPRPTDCPDYWYDLMRTCWRYDTRDRPMFCQIVDYLAAVTDRRFHQMSFVLNHPEQFEGIPPYDFTNVPAPVGTRRHPLLGERLTFGDSFDSDHCDFDDDASELPIISKELRESARRREARADRSTRDVPLQNGVHSVKEPLVQPDD